MAVKKLGDLLKSLATKMKLDLADDKLKPLFDLDTPVEEAHATAFEQMLMTEDAAVANTKIRNKIKAESLNGLDSVLEELMTENEFDDAAIAEIKSADTSFKRTKLIGKKIGELQAAKAAAKNPDDKKAIQKLIDDAKQEAVTAKTTAAKQIEDLNKAHEAKIYNMGLTGILQTKKYYSDDISATVHAITAKTLLEQSLAKSGAKLIFDDASQTFKLVTAETGTDYFDANGKKVTPDEYIDGVLAENKLLKTAGDPPPKTDPIITPGDKDQKPNQGMLNTIDAQLG